MIIDLEAMVHISKQAVPSAARDAAMTLFLHHYELKQRVELARRDKVDGGGHSTHLPTSLVYEM